MNHEFAQSKVNKSDEFYTLDYAIIPLIKYIPKNKTIWCPFDKKESRYVVLLKENGYNVIYGHIETGQDFFNYVPEYDILISNPPYSLRTPILEKLFMLKKPFALLINESGLFDTKKRYELLRKNPLPLGRGSSNDFSYGKGEWEAKSLLDAKQMAIDFADSVS